jgi:hypothetical protein
VTSSKGMYLPGIMEGLCVEGVQLVIR